jgi:hypothetical protein
MGRARGQPMTANPVATIIQQAIAGATEAEAERARHPNGITVTLSDPDHVVVQIVLAGVPGQWVEFDSDQFGKLIADMLNRHAQMGPP